MRLSLPDAAIAASAELTGRTLLTRNRRDFEALTDLIAIAYFSQLRLANVHTVFMRSEPRPGAALASAVPCQRRPETGLGAIENEKVRKTGIEFYPQG
jgi:hypothetical protein